MNKNNPALRHAFLTGFLDAMDALARPSIDVAGDPATLSAWQAGQDHWEKLVRGEQRRLEEAVKTGEGFPDF